ncbi:DUF2867 domain-containing protein [Phycisphaera mikurensis]|uniref:NmrA-like domain-containing protein n=1 Tax=Phycisphaera mikurensis (strain NBRC 102666 / KCTC 22515 / FYK2301M01) TaxID=1142394 RepID=I0IB79_PHYMF|nr:DUF2867 domain-containing protein [Phycisphaera mikurensis]MBB6443015.1 uncharacterized protein YbjT (DUF2867 family) [Phycisphaera mikurensis]BAM02517.1 hypothetical protein PSMK_03580 [Phycisphaera mikurensis NBRC 102666]
MTSTTLVTGATGYIGGRLVPRLLGAGHRVRVLVRGTDSIKGRAWERDVEVVRGDLLDAGSLLPALRGVGTAYYLVHSMTAGEGFEERDRTAAQHFVEACRRGRSEDRLPHVIYLGGLQPAGGEVSAHLSSRAETGAILAAGLPGRVTEFRAGPIIGSGSASFEMVRYLTERLPVMICPSWVDTVVTPVAIRDVLAYLVAAGSPEGPGPAGTLDIGTEPHSFRELMLELAAVRGLRRRIVRVPLVAAGLAARWVSLVTPIPLDLARPLVKGTTRDLIADTAKARRLFPNVRPIPYRRAVELAMERTSSNSVETRWSGAPPDAGDGPASGSVQSKIDDREGVFRDQRILVTAAAPKAVFAAICRIGGPHGYHGWGWAWKLRGLMDAAIGGPGLRRGRRDPDRILEGEALDFWRVERLIAPQECGPGEAALLRLRAEMKVPGVAYLQWESSPCAAGTRIVQTALFEPRGFRGLVYWYAMLPAHGFIFPGMVRGVAKTAVELQAIHEALRQDGKQAAAVAAEAGAPA